MYPVLSAPSRLVASTIEGGDTLAPIAQALATPFQNIAERVGLAADDPYVKHLDDLEAKLDRAFAETRLPEAPSVWDEVNRLVVAARERGPGGE